MTPDATYARSTYEAKLDISYYVRLYVLQEILFARLDKLAVFLQLLAGSGAFYAVTDGNKGLTQACTVVVTAISLACLVYDPAGKARNMRDAVRRYMQLLAEADDLTLAEIDKRLATIGADVPTHVDGLRHVAFNLNLLSHGRASHCLPLTRWQRFLRWLA